MHLVTLQAAGQLVLDKNTFAFDLGAVLPRPISVPAEGEGESRLINSSGITKNPKGMRQK